MQQIYRGGGGEKAKEINLKSKRATDLKVGLG
jgi:hypothetical protein